MHLNSWGGLVSSTVADCDCCKAKNAACLWSFAGFPINCCPNNSSSWNAWRMTNSNRSVLAFNLSYLFRQSELLGEVMTQLLAWLDEGRIAPPPVRTFPLERVAEAHRELESGQTVGKVVLVCGDSARASA